MSSSKVQRSHRDMYKARTPPWKETYRKRCLDRLRDSREKLKSRYRKLPDNSASFVEELMREEWKSLREEQEKQALDDADLQGAGTLENLDIDHILDMFDDIQVELRQEEVRMLEEYENYERGLSLEEQSLCSAIDKLCTDEVVCPLCKKNPLLANKSVIFCNCGMRINTEQDCLTLGNIKQQLDSGLELHGQGCECEPIFSLMADMGTNNHLNLPGGALAEMGTNNLLMTCPDCDWMSVVI